ncbi:PIG-L deacetylase family protein [Streptomyces roseicoloratus]|uniref:PIG-L family deacetylase n=1 Tax=Streptomyces roseicoloratus TaxID=2508722 RepID=A0ABY9S364_9ACTN|nr:PIG-L family deacetylase [Streptomyces roseicoloratus]WMX48368.1 PIG-L family deacetylase [Streptomyces roseicoloratus]
MADDPLTALSAPAGSGHVLVLSPHLDDAVLSCGALLARLPGRRSSRASVTVMTVFTEGAPPPYTRAGRRFLRRTGRTDAEELYAERRTEDAAVLARLGVARVHAGFVDGLFRPVPAPGRLRRRVAGKVPELGHVYPTNRLHLSRGRVSPRDAETVRRVTDTVRELLQPGQGVLLAPLAVGGHVDHVLVRTAAVLSGLPAVFYSDFPYNVDEAPDPDFTGPLDATETSLGEGLDEKAELIRGYRTQVDTLFPGGVIPRVPEVYLLPAGVREAWTRTAGGPS